RRRQICRTNGHPAEHQSWPAVAGRPRVRSARGRRPAPSRLPPHAARGGAHRRTSDVLPQRDSARVLKTLRRAAYGVEVIEHTIPTQLDAGETYGVRATFRNMGKLSWPHGGPHPVDLFVLIDNELYQKVALPHGEVP